VSGGVAAVTRLSPLAALLAVLALGCAERPPAERYSTSLQSLNDSGVKGKATATLAGRHLTLDIRATGMEPNRTHDQDLQGFPRRPREAACPTDEQDRDRSGLLEAGEEESRSGRRILALEPYPTVESDGRLDYRLTFTVDPDAVEPMDSRVLVLRGMSTESGGSPTDDYAPSLPVACGTFTPVVQ